MVDSNHDNIINNINKLIDATDLSDVSIANMLNLSIRKFKYLKRGKVKLKLIDIELFTNFFNVSINDLSKINFKTNSQTRERLKEKYKSNVEYAIHFEQTPTITYSVKYVLINSPLFHKPMEVNEIKSLFKSRGWIYRSSSISQALARQTELVKIQNHPTKKNIFLYSKK